jgi:hypothetical protein
LPPSFETRPSDAPQDEVPEMHARAQSRDLG